MWNLKYNTNKPIYKIETDSDMDNRPMVVSGERQWERDGLGVWDQQMQATIYEMDKQQGPTAQHRELYSVSHGKLNHFVVQQKLTEYCKSTILQLKKNSAYIMELLIKC